jgi:lipopolysaccharide/colanic/teichoic acid biosynthesis glycosyltransferase
MKFSQKIISSKTAIPFWKRALDIGLILLAAPVVIPLSFFLAALIRAVSAGPVLFRQERVGHLGRIFLCYKFRTMFAGADAASHRGYLEQLIRSGAPMMKMDARGDSRIIPLGRWLRASGLDELPQLLNVLRGEMSLVGPRPCLPYEFEKYLPEEKERFNAVPGLTGLWQVSGKNKTTFAEMIRLDVQYARTRNLRLDCGIILKTIPVLLVQILEMLERKKSLSKTPAQPAIFPARIINH